MLASPSFFADIVMPSASEAISRTISGTAALGLARLAGLDEPGVLGEAAGVEEEGHAVAVADRADAAQVLEAHRLAAARVVGDRDEDDRDASPARARRAARRARARSMLPLNGCSTSGWRPSSMTRSTASAPGELDVGAGRVEVGVVGDRLARVRRSTEKRIFSAARPWWVGMTWRNGNSSWTASEERVPGRAAGVATRRRAGSRPTGRGSSRRCRSR